MELMIPWYLSFFVTTPAFSSWSRLFWIFTFMESSGNLDTSNKLFTYVQYIGIQRINFIKIYIQFKELGLNNNKQFKQ